MDFLSNPTRILFFTGKGGVGKTSLACAAAIQLADQQRRVLLVSTDPASNLDEVLDTELETTPTPVRGVTGLAALNIDPEASAREYRERMVGPYRGILPDDAIRSMEEQFSGSCTVEIAAFDEFARLLGDHRVTEQYDHVLFDTAPTGHTLRLLTLPSAWSGFIENNTTGTSCLGPLSGLQAQQQVYSQTAEAIRDATLTTLILVSRPEESALEEAARTSAELQQLGVSNQHLAVNGVIPVSETADPIARAMAMQGEQAISAMPLSLRDLDCTTVPLAGHSVMGIKALRHLGTDRTALATVAVPRSKQTQLPESLESLIDQLAVNGRGVILTMGKGGVGKTTIASAIAVALAERGESVHLSTTDPAAHLQSTLGSASHSNLHISRIDPAVETAQYTAEVMATAGADLDSQGKALLEEDLRSPCTEEIAVFRAFARTVAEGIDRFVVLDTAPTGHTILLLDSALAYHREVTRQSSIMPENVEQLLPRLRDQEVTRVLIVTLPEATPVHEAARLQEDLRRAEIEPYAWVVNRSLLPLDISDTLLTHRQAAEGPFVDKVCGQLAERTALVGWQPDAPTGLAGLRQVLGAE